MADQAQAERREAGLGCGWDDGFRPDVLEWRVLELGSGSIEGRQMGLLGPDRDHL
jgi:hypothetical protein